MAKSGKWVYLFLHDIAESLEFRPDFLTCVKRQQLIYRYYLTSIQEINLFSADRMWHWRAVFSLLRRLLLNGKTEQEKKSIQTNLEIIFYVKRRIREKQGAKLQNDTVEYFVLSIKLFEKENLMCLEIRSTYEIICALFRVRLKQRFFYFEQIK